MKPIASKALLLLSLGMVSAFYGKALLAEPNPPTQNSYSLVQKVFDNLDNQPVVKFEVGVLKGVIDNKQNRLKLEGEKGHFTIVTSKYRYELSPKGCQKAPSSDIDWLADQQLSVRPEDLGWPSSQGQELSSYREKPGGHLYWRFEDRFGFTEAKVKIDKEQRVREFVTSYESANQAGEYKGALSYPKESGIEIPKDCSLAEPATHLNQQAK